MVSMSCFCVPVLTEGFLVEKLGNHRAYVLVDTEDRGFSLDVILVDA